MAKLNAQIEALAKKGTPPSHIALIKRYMPELMVAARAKHGEILPCSGHTDWLKCVVVYEDFNQVMFNYNDAAGNTYAVTLPIEPENPMAVAIHKPGNSNNATPC